MSDNGKPEALTARETIRLMMEHAHEEKMARALRPAEATFEIAQKSPAGKTGGFEFTITGPDPDEVERKALEWAEKFPAPQPAVKA